MADQQGEVVIVGADGAEHVFPAGFDPKRAASIVRGGATAQPAAPAPQGYWEDHPVLGKTWHPPGVKPGFDAASHRIDRPIVGWGTHGAGIAPEDVLMGGMIGRNIVGATKAGGALAGVKQTIAEANPIIKFEVLRRGMTAAGMPDAMATPLAMVLSGYRRGGGAAKAAETAASDVSAPGFPRLTKTKPPAPPPGGWTPEGPPPGESLPGYPRVTPTEAPAAPTPVPQPGESLEGFPRVTRTAAPAAPTPVPQPGESLEGFPRMTRTGAPVAPTPVPQPGESLEGFPRMTRTGAPAAPTPVPQPGESLPGYPRLTETEATVQSPLDMLLNRAVRQAEQPPAGPYGSAPGYPRLTPTEPPIVRPQPPSDVPVAPGESLPGYPRLTTTPPPVSATPSVLDELLNEPVRAVGRGVTPADAVTANLEQRVAPVVEGAPSQTATLKKTATGRTGSESRGAGQRFKKKAPTVTDEGWITPDELLESVGAPASTGKGFWRGLRRGDLWPQLQEEMLSTAEAPAPASAAQTRPGRTGPGAQGKGGRFAPKAPAASDLETTLRARHAADVAEFNAGQEAAKQQGYTGPDRKPSSFEAWIEDEADMGNADAASWLTKNLTTRTGGK